MTTIYKALKRLNEDHQLKKYKREELNESYYTVTRFDPWKGRTVQEDDFDNLEEARKEFEDAKKESDCVITLYRDGKIELDSYDPDIDECLNEEYDDYDDRSEYITSYVLEYGYDVQLEEEYTKSDLGINKYDNMITPSTNIYSFKPYGNYDNKYNMVRDDKLKWYFIPLGYDKNKWPEFGTLDEAEEFMDNIKNYGVDKALEIFQNLN